MTAGRCEPTSLVVGRQRHKSTGPAGHWEGIMSLLFEILIGAIVVAAVGNLLIGLLPRRDKVEPADMERR